MAMKISKIRYLGSSISTHVHFYQLAEAAINRWLGHPEIQCAQNFETISHWVQWISHSWLDTSLVTVCKTLVAPLMFLFRTQISLSSFDPTFSSFLAIGPNPYFKTLATCLAIAFHLFLNFDFGIGPSYCPISQLASAQKLIFTWSAPQDRES